MKSKEDEAETSSIAFNATVREWLRISKIHGLDRLVVTKTTPLKLVWLVCFLVSACLCSFLVGRIVADYLRFEVKTRIREVYPESVPFPKISVCNYNPLVSRNANAYVQAYFKTQFNLTVSKYADLHDTRARQKLIDPSEELDFILYLINHPGFNATLRKSFGYEFLLVCIYYFNTCDETAAVSEYFDADYGYCYMINSNSFGNGSRRQPYEAYLQNFGLRLVMFTGPPQNETNYLFTPDSDKTGILVRVEAPDYEGMLLSGIGVAPGTHAEVIVNRVETKNMPAPYSHCVPADSVRSDALPYMTQMGFVPYSRRTCMYVCGQLINLRLVGCVSLFYPVWPNATLCETREQYERVRRGEFNFTACNEMCPIECESVAYETTVSYTSWPTYNSFYQFVSNTQVSDELRPHASDMAGFESARQSFASAFIAFDKIKYTEITETPSLTFVDLVAAIGGMLGLFLGISLMIVVELVELGIEFVWFVLVSRYRRPKCSPLEVHFKP